MPKFQITNQFQWFDAVSFTFGAHQMKFGLDLRAPMRNIFLDVPGLRGSLTFDGQRTGNGLVGNRGGLAIAVADCLADGTLPGDVRTIDMWFSPAAYAVPTPARLGTCGRNTLDGPGYSNVDFALARSFKYFGENRSLEFRWEVFTAFNHAQFGLPERNRASTAADRISTLAGDPRVMQFAMKFYF